MREHHCTNLRQLRPGRLTGLRGEAAGGTDTLGMGSRESVKGPLRNQMALQHLLRGHLAPWGWVMLEQQPGDRTELWPWGWWHHSAIRQGACGMAEPISFRCSLPLRPLHTHKHGEPSTTGAQ